VMASIIERHPNRPMSLTRKRPLSGCSLFIETRRPAVVSAANSQILVRLPLTAQSCGAGRAAELSRERVMRA
jgi:hypothetical protein